MIFFITTNNNVVSDNSFNVWFKFIPLKFLCLLGRYRVTASLQKITFAAEELLITTSVFVHEGVDWIKIGVILFVRCEFYGRLRYLVANWLGFTTVGHIFFYHRLHFGML